MRGPTPSNRSGPDSVVPPKCFGVEHVDPGDAMRKNGVVVQKPDRPHGLEAVEKLDQGIRLRYDTVESVSIPPSFLGSKAPS